MKATFLSLLVVAGITLMLAPMPVSQSLAGEPEGLKPLGDAKGIHPGRVVWVHDPEVSDWKGPGDGHWWEANRTRQEHVDAMMSRAIRELTGEATVAGAWDKLFRHLNQSRGKGNNGYQRGEKIAIKVNFVGMIWLEGAVNEESYTLKKRQDYMNTSPQMILALLGQLVKEVGVQEKDISVGDTLAYLVNEYYDLMHPKFPNVQFVDFAGKFGRVQTKQSEVPFNWSSHPQDSQPDFLPTFITDSAYLVNLANLKAHTGAGVTLCAKNHFGSLVRWPAQKGYYNIHPNAFSTKEKIYRPLVDLMGHNQLGGKTVLYMLDGLYSGKHPSDPAPRKWSSAPFNGGWTASLLASQDPVAIDSVGFDLLRTEYEDYPRKGGVDDYLHEAALAENPPSGTFYDPNHATAVKRLTSLGVHEHWNNAQDKKYSRNLNAGNGIELMPVELGGATKP